MTNYTGQIYSDIKSDYDIYGKKITIQDYYDNGTSYVSDIWEFYAIAVYKMDDVLVRYQNKIQGLTNDFVNNGFDKEKDKKERFLRKNF